MAFPLIAIPIIGDLLKGVTSIIQARIPDVNQRAQIEAELQQAVMQMDWAKVEKEFQDRADARALAQTEAKMGNAFTMMLSAVVRPAWGLASLTVVAYPYLAGALHWPSVTIDDATKDIVQTVIMFYFGGRTVEYVMGTVARAKANGK